MIIWSNVSNPIAKVRGEKKEKEKEKCNMTPIEKKVACPLCMSTKIINKGMW